VGSINKPIAVISGDIVNSTKLTKIEYERLLANLKDIQTWITEENSKNAHSIVRGDEFQSVIHDIQHVLRYTIIYRLSIKSLGKAFDSRISFAIAANAELRELLPESMGEAFVLSGRGLKEIKNDRLLFTCEYPTLTEQFELLFKYLDKQITELTARQSEVLLPMIKSKKDLTISELAEELNIATATTSKSLKASGWSLIKALNTKFVKQVMEFKYD